RDGLRLNIDHLDPMVIRIGDVELAVGDAKAPRFVKAAKKRFASLRLRIEHFEFTVVGIGDVELSLVINDTEGMLQADFGPDAVLVAEAEEPVADQSAHLSRRRQP